MADANANIRIDVDTSAALSQIKELQRQISIFHSRMAQSGKAAAAESAKMQANLINSINATKGFSAGMTNIRTATESFTNSLEKNKFSMGEYFRYAGASTKTFGKLFKSEFATINKVARERVKDLQTQYIKMGRDANGAMQAIKIRPTTLDMQNLGTQTAIAAQKQQLFNQLMKQGSTNMLNWGKNTQWAGRQLMVGFTIPLTIMGAAASREFMKLEEQAIRFKRVYGDMFTSSKETQQALDDVRELAREFTKFGVAVEDTIDLAASVAQMGAMGADLTNQVTQATRLAVLGGIEQQEALDTTISLTNAFGLATDQLAGKIAFLNAAENQTILSIEDFNEAIPKAGSVVKQLGGDVEDLAYFLTAMREGGINASQSANALKSSLARLINPTEVSREKLGAFGIDILGIVNDNAGNLRKTIQVLAVELDKLDPLNKSRAIEQLFGKFQFARMSTLFENIVKEGSQANKILELTTNSTEELAIIAERELARVSESPMYKFKKAIEQFQVALAPIGEAFLKLVTPLIEFGTRVMEQFDKLSDGTKTFITGAVAIGGVVAPALLMIVGLLANGIANTIKFATMIRNAFSGTSQSTDLLTNQYQYMNSEQIEAAAVAASLDQVHSKLRQTFTSEAASIDRLVAAYQRAIVKQNQMAASGAAFGGSQAGRKKYASGVVSVPGPKGAGDIVPAMLSPGEAVVPAKMAQKYAPLIQGMIADNIPGFKKGVSSVNFAHVGPGAQVPVGKVLADPSIVPTAAVRRRMETLQGIDSNAPVNLKHSYGVAMDSQVNNRLGKQGGAGADELAAQFTGKDIEKRYGEMGGLIGADMKDPQLQKEFASYDKAMSEKLKGLKKQGIKSVVDTEEQWKALPKAQQKTTTSLEKMDKEVAKDIGKSNKKFIAARKKGLGTVRDIRIGEGLTPEQKKKILANRTANKSIIRRVSSKGDDVRVYTSNQRKAKGGFGQFPNQTKAYNDGLAKSANTNSESKRTKRIAKDTVDGYANELKRGQKKVSAAGKKAAEEKLRQEEAANRRSAAARRGWETRRRNVEAASAAGVAGGGGFRGRMAGVGAKFRGSGAKMAGVGMAASTGLMLASQMGGPMGDMAGKLMGPVMALSAILPLMTAKMGAGVVALGALVAVAVLAKQSFNKAQDESMKLAEALGGGSEAMKRFSEAAGKASAGEVMDKRRANQFGVFQVQPGKDSFGNTFMGSDAGAQMLESVRSSLKVNGAAGTQDMVRNQLMTAVASGAMDAAQARSVVAALATELEDYGFGIELNAQIIELIGPNGEKLKDDPVGIRVAILEESQDNLATSFENLNKAAGRSVADNIASGMGIAAGAGAGALAGAVLGSFILPGIGTAIGAVVGTIAGGITGAVADIGGYIGSKVSGDPSRQERIGTASGASVAMAKIALQQQQEMLDSVELEYEKRIEAAKSAGDLAEAERLATEQVEARVKLLEQNRELNEQIMASYGDASPELQKALMSGAGKSMQAAYEDTALEDVVPLVQDLINDNVQDEEVRYLLTMQVASKEIGPLQMMEFLQTFEKDSIEQDAIVNIMANNTGAFAGQVMSLIGLFKDNKAMQSDILLNINSTKSPDEAERLLNFYQRLTQTDSRITRQVKFDYVMNNPEEAAKLQKTLEDLDNFQGEVTLDVVANIAGAEAVKAVNSDLEYFQGLNDDMKKIYLNTVVTSLEVITPNSGEFLNWLNSEGAGYRGRPWGEKQQAYAAYNANLVTKAAIDMTGQSGDTPPPSGSGGGPKSSVLDDLTKKIRDLRLETFKATVGWDASAKALENLFRGGDKSLDVFTGLANKMRSLGASSGMIDMILGMDPQEFEKRKKELFNLDPQGNIVSLTSKFKSFGAAVNAIAMGEYVNSQEAFIENTRNQFTAMNRLTAEGLSFVQAYEMVQDQALATAIAMAASNEEVEQLIELAEKLKKFQDKKSQIDEEANAAKAVARTNKEFRERYHALSEIAKAGSSLSDSEINAILSDPNLTKLYLNPQIDRKTLEQRLRQAEAEANLQIRLKVATEEGKEAMFDEVMGEINDQFARKEQEVDIKFRLDTEADSDIVREAENKIAAIQYEIDDYQAQLKGISDQEEIINEKYDDRFEALDKVGAANERIARAQQAQLDVADALSRGDIAAAARAQAQLRAQEAEASVQERRELLERQRAAELSNVRSASGKSRVQLEEEIKKKNDEIFKIQEDELEPAQENIRQAEYQKQLALDGLTIADKTRDEWDKIANAVDLATVNAEEFELAVKRALALFEYFVNGKPLDLSLFGEEELQQLIDEGSLNPGDLADAIANEVAEAVAEGSTAGPTSDSDSGGPVVAKTPESIQKIKDAANETVQKMISQGVDSLTDFERILIGAPGATMSSGEFARNALGSMMGSGGMNSLSPQERLMLGLEGGDKDGYVTKSVPKSSLPASQKPRVDTSSLAGVIEASKPNVTIKTPPSSSVSNANKAKAQQAVVDKAHNAGVTQAKKNMTTPTKNSNATKQVTTKHGRLPSYIAAYLSGGGMVKGYAMGGKIAKYAKGGMSLGSDTVPAMLTPGEFVLRRPAAQAIGLEKLEQLNKTGTYNDGSVYNYNLAVNVSSMSDPDKIARTVMKEIKRVESQRVRGNRF